MAIIGPFSVGYPVAFRSGGDTTRVAFGKHIQEIERIYGILNALDADKISASDLDSKLAGFKPKLSFSDISGNIDMSRITGNLDFSRITGNVPATRVVGKLSNANIDTANVNGLTDFVKGLIPAPSGGSGDGITDVEAEENGYVKFANGFMIQWGYKTALGLGTDNIPKVDDITFPAPFQNKCLNVVLSPGQTGSSAHINAKWGTQLLDGSIKSSGFNFVWMFYPSDNPLIGGDNIMKMRYSAFGY
ncbi:MAG: hypothetical protein IJS42_03580 [Synergistaceae bacterium]|nr:hypothetical protein [Synergistaceae bacterium]